MTLLDESLPSLTLSQASMPISIFLLVRSVRRPCLNPNFFLFRHESVMLRPIGGSHWTLHYFPAFSDAIFFQNRLYLTHAPDDYPNIGGVRVVEYDFQTKNKRQIFSGRDGMEESASGHLLKQEILAGLKLLPRTERDLANNEETNWPRGRKRIIFLGCQRSDLSVSRLKGSIRKKNRILSIWRFLNSVLMDFMFMLMIMKEMRCPRFNLVGLFSIKSSDGSNNLMLILAHIRKRVKDQQHSKDRQHLKEHRLQKHQQARVQPQHI
ncbi:uncharacterized protein LOC110022954 [Phalaenopsis equestris]|uniref:uncharacterized protein LOC110022954 n=1 Tax=Phalaenopsis equestris TaxID=78828 RepID=UPI0009E357F1|nr:uncharacterized protein LOC110022954 [Phalaenopsis equestris]